MECDPPCCVRGSMLFPIGFFFPQQLLLHLAHLAEGRAQWHRSGQQSELSYPVFWEWGRDGEGKNFARWMLNYAVPPCFGARE